MQHFLPLATFEHDGQAVIAVDSDATVRLCNRAARRLLGLSPTAPLPAKCWGLAACTTLDGEPFCQHDCPVQKAAREGRCGAQHWAVPARGTHAGRPIEIVSFFLPWDGSNRRAVLHFLRPASVGTADRALSPPACLEAARQISEREATVLRLLSEGHSTPAIGDALRISPNTVRHHLSNIFHKLGVHGRVEALAAITRTVASAGETTPQGGENGLARPRQALASAPDDPPA